MSSSTMYKMKPVFDFPAPFQHTNSMYKLKNIQFSRISDSSGLISQESHISENTELHSDEKLVLSRQEKLLAELSKLKDQINAFRLEVEKLKVSQPVVPKSNHISVPSASGRLDYTTFLNEISTHGVVINANPNNPPYCLLALNKIWKNLPIQVSIHVHSSIVALPGQLKSFEILQKLNLEIKSTVNVTLVWKDVGEDCELVVSPVRNTPIVGEVNLLRFFDQYLSSDSLNEKILKNEFLDIAHQLQHFTGNKKLDLMKQLSEKLASNDYFSNAKNPNLADLALWSSFMKMKKKDNLPQNISKWIQRSSAYFGV